MSTILITTINRIRDIWVIGYWLNVNRRLTLPTFLAYALLSSTPNVLANNGSEEPLELSKAIDIAVRDNPNLAEIDSRFQSLSLLPAQQRALPDPMIHLNAMNFPVDTFDREQEPMTQLQIGISQSLPFPGKLRLKGEIAELMAKVAEQNLAEARLQLIKKVKDTWWQLYYLDRALETINQTQVLLEQFITVAQTKYETGKGLQQDVLLSQLELSRLLDRRIQLLAARQTQSIGFNLLMNRASESAILLPPDVTREIPNLRSTEALYDLAENNRPLLKLVQHRLDAAETRLTLAQRNYYPNFNLGLMFGERTGENPGNGDKRADLVTLMLGVKVPLYAGQKQSQAVALMSKELESNQYSVQDKQEEVRSQISAAVVDFRRAQEQYLLFSSGIVPQATQTVESMLAGYQVNVVDFLNLVRSQVTLFNYELQYWQALAEANQALARIQAAVGTESVYE
ncbi:MAG TPA: transporter [Gammaproteobacteria bacterium]|nr:transporter [Gammaproteobacteria bacterium]